MCSAALKNIGEIMALKSIEAEWEGFAKMVFAKMKPSKTQYVEMRKAFFAGAWALFNMTEEIGEPSVSEQQAVDHLESIRTECLAYRAQLITEYRERN